MVGTLMSGGIMYGTPAMYYNNLHLRADDIRAGKILSDNQIGHYGNVRAFFELDYRHNSEVPSDDEMLRHVRICQETIRVNFPESDVACHVCITPLKTKAEILCAGVHIIFEHVILQNVDELREAAEVANAQICKDSVYDSVVDSASSHSQHASLRPIHAHKITDCWCKHKTTLNDLPSFDKACPLKCYAGRLVHPALYTFAYSLAHDGVIYNNVEKPTLLQQLQLTSIISPKNIAITGGTTKSVSSIKTTSKTISDLMAKVLYRHDSHFTGAQICENVVFDRVKNTISAYIIENLYCVFHGAEHSSNRSRMIIYLRTGKAYFNCLDSECRKNQKKAFLKQSEYMLSKTKGKRPIFPNDELYNRMSCVLNDIELVGILNFVTVMPELSSADVSALLDDIPSRIISQVLACPDPSKSHLSKVLQAREDYRYENGDFYRYSKCKFEIKRNLSMLQRIDRSGVARKRMMDKSTPPVKKLKICSVSTGTSRAEIFRLREIWKTSVSAK